MQTKIEDSSIGRVNALISSVYTLSCTPRLYYERSSLTERTEVSAVQFDLLADSIISHQLSEYRTLSDITTRLLAILVKG
jgi:hypothetical protein